MDDSVFSSQFQAMRDAFAREGIAIEVAYTPSGRVDYIYETGRLLVQLKDEARVRDALPGAQPASEQPALSSVRVLSIDHLHDGYLTVPQALDVLDTKLKLEAPAPGHFPEVTPVHILHICQSPDTVRTCPATEPEVPCCCGPDEPCAPCPPLAPDGGAGVVIGICDSGLLADIASSPWLAGVTGDLDPLGPVLPGGLSSIPRYCGHGTFVAGVTRSQAPQSAVHVAADFVMAGGEREWIIVQQLQALATRDPAPQVVNLSAGSYARHDWPLLSFIDYEAGGITLTAAAGNDATDRKFWPAAFDWAVAVGALGADHRHRAWFSNYGDWVQVYTPGEGLVNAFATGEYTYQEPPKRPAVQEFGGMARWSGTSFAAPLIAGLVAARLASSGVSAAEATQTLLAQAASQAIYDASLNRTLPVLYPWHP